MTWPVRHLTVLQNWDCNGCTACCREYRVHVSDEERTRIAAQGWDREPEFAGQPLFVREGRWGTGSWHLRHHPDGTCIFLNDQGRCRIHEKFGGAAKPLACRVFPFVLVPAGGHWRVGLRYACPSVAANHGRLLREHDADLRDYAGHLFEQSERSLANLASPPLQGRQRVDWSDVFHFVEALTTILGQKDEPIERRWRRCLALARLCRQARFDQVRGDRLVEFLRIVSDGIDDEMPPLTAVPPPTWVGRILFRQVLALFCRKDSGPERGISSRGRLALLGAAWRFARGSGPVPRVHALMPDTTFEELEKPAGPLPEGAERVLERYYSTKVESLQFCGPSNSHMPFWTGLDLLALTLPAIRWLARGYRDLTPEAAVIRAVSIVDNNFGFNPLLGTSRQRLALAILSSRGELERLIAWYSR